MTCLMLQVTLSVFILNKHLTLFKLQSNIVFLNLVFNLLHCVKHSQGFKIHSIKTVSVYWCCNVMVIMMCKTATSPWP